MHPHELPDWRIYFGSRIEEVRGPNAMGAKAGDLIVPVTEMKIPDLGRVMVPVVSPYRLALSIAIRASHEAKRLRKEITFAPAPRGMKAKPLESASTPVLYDYFEQCMIAATFSFQALETYSNAVIEHALKDGKTLSLQRKAGTFAFDAESLQRDVSTDEKIVAVLPMLLGIPFSKSAKLWQQFTILKRVRDSTIHLKAKDRYVLGETDRETVFYRLLQNDPKLYARTALGIMGHFSGGAELTWLRFAEDRLTG